MTWMICGVALLVYVVGSYILVYRSMRKNAGPAGLGMLIVPFAPLILPYMLGMAIAYPFQKLWRAIKR